MGQIRYYMTPPGLLKPEEVPGAWGLLEVHGSKVSVRKKAGFDHLQPGRSMVEVAYLVGVFRQFCRKHGLSTTLRKGTV